VIIPCLNEEFYLAKLLRSLNNYGFWEIIVVDGGSTDRSKEIASEYTPKVIDSATGRGNQLNRGAEGASGEALLFLHADSSIKSDIAQSIGHCLSISENVGGAFKLKIDSARPGLRFISSCANIRTKLFSLPYGDQGIFARRKAFDTLGGFKHIPIMEDVDFVKRIKSEGKFVMLDDYIYTSPRRWQQEGIIICTLRNWMILLLYSMGIPATKLKKYYKHRR
jgi:rSAM/selenodomain-associated transferase 2